MEKERKYLADPQTGRLNSDDSAFIVGTNEWINAENVRSGSTDAGVTGVIESIGSTELISTPAPSRTYLEIGSTEDTENNRFCYFLVNTNITPAAEKAARSFLAPSRISTGTVFTVTVDDPSFGIITLATYTQQAGDTTEPIFIANLIAAINQNSFGYTSIKYLANVALYIYARPNLGASINGNDAEIDWVVGSTSSAFTGGRDGVIKQDKIITYYADTNTEYETLLSSQVTGGLNFDENSIIHSAKIINGMLYWVDSTNNQPRKINIESAIKANYPSFQTNQVAYSFPINFSEITLIKPPPPLSPDILKGTDGGFDNNFIANESFEFAFQYTWYDNETTVVGTYSPASRLNSPTDTFNKITVFMDSAERIPDTVRIVSLVVRIGNTNFSQIIKTWDKEVTAEAVQIAEQNTSVSLLSFDYYNNITGQSLPEADTLRPFDNVPIFSETMEQAKDRNHLANNTEGYDTPNLTSLSIALANPISLTGGTNNENLILLRFVSRDFFTGNYNGYSAYYVYLTWYYPNGYYLVSTVNRNSSSTPTYPPAPTIPTTIAVGAMVFKGSTAGQVAANEKLGSGTVISILTTNTANVIAITGVSQSTYNVFAQKSPFKAGTVFYDFAMRKCGVVTKEGLVVSTPTRNYAYSTAVSAINWTLSNNNAVNEIPDWAYYYTPVWTLNQRTRFFIQAYSNTNKYATKNENNEFVFTNDTFVSNAVGIGLNTTALNKAGLGYVFSEGDVCILIKSDNTVYELPVIGQQGTYIVVKAEDIGTLASTAFIFEIYTPYKSSTQEPFYEMGEMYRVLNPTTEFRQYESLFGALNADSYALTRNFNAANYFAGAMSPNDLYYKRWETDAGKANFITKLGQVVKTQYGSFSDTFIPNTAINGLSTFRLGNQYQVPQDCGAIRKLQLTSKIQSEGTVMLSICEVETNSMYLGEAQITDSTGQTQFFSQETSVVGTINTLKGNRGTINPESVIQYRGNVYWLDMNNGRIVRYSANGIFDISDYKMARFWKLFCLQFMSMSTSEIEALGSRPFVFATVDGGHDELLFSIPKLLENPPKGYLPDYPSEIYPFDIWDGRGKSVVYCLGTVNNNPHWQGSYKFNPEGFITLQNRLYSFKQGLLYVHNSLSSQNNFYGVQYTSKIMVVSNQVANLVKVYENILVESNIVPFFVYFYNEYPYVQTSDLVDYSFRALEGVWYSTILRNKIVPTAIGYNTDGLLTGEKMRNVAMMIMVEFSPTTNPLSINFIEVGYSKSRGQEV